MSNESNVLKEYYRTNHLVYSCQYHVIFCPKYRRKVLTNGKDIRLKEIFLETAASHGFIIHEMEVMPDHVHLIVNCNPRYGIMQCIKDLKRESASLMRKEFPDLKSRLPCM